MFMRRGMKAGGASVFCFAAGGRGRLKRMDQREIGQSAEVRLARGAGTCDKREAGRPTAVPVAGEVPAPIAKRIAKSAHSISVRQRL